MLCILKYDAISDADTPDLRPAVPPVHSSSLYYPLYQQHTRTVTVAVVILHQQLRAVIGYAIALQQCSMF